MAKVDHSIVESWTIVGILLRFASGSCVGALLVVGVIFAGWCRMGTFGYSLERSGSQLSNGV